MVTGGLTTGAADGFLIMIISRIIRMIAAIGMIHTGNPPILNSQRVFAFEAGHVPSQIRTMGEVFNGTGTVMVTSMKLKSSPPLMGKRPYADHREYIPLPLPFPFVHQCVQPDSALPAVFLTVPKKAPSSISLMSEMETVTVIVSSFLFSFTLSVLQQSFRPWCWFLPLIA